MWFIAVHIVNLHDSKLWLFNCLDQDMDTDIETNGAGSGAYGRLEMGWSDLSHKVFDSFIMCQNV